MKMIRNATLSALSALFGVAMLAAPAIAQDSQYEPVNQQIPSPDCLTSSTAYAAALAGGNHPCPAGTHDAWLKDLEHWRTERRIRVGYDGSRYTLPALQWTQSSFIQPQMMVQDRYFYDPVAGKYTVDRYLDDVEKRYGGIDAVLVWSTYPNMGMDDRNQHDMVRSMPGGIAGVQQMVADFHRRGVRVLFPMMMWDQGTHDPGTSWPQAIAEFMKELNADGINGDTQDGVPLAFSRAAEKTGHPLAFEPEGSPADEAVAWNVMTWGQYKFPFAPWWTASNGWRPVTWSTSPTGGIAIRQMICNLRSSTEWDGRAGKIFGEFGMASRRAMQRATRRMATIERGVAPFLVSPEWEPLYPTIAYGIFASRWPLENETVWTIVNRNEYDITGRQIELLHSRHALLRSVPWRGIAPDHEGGNDVVVVCDRSARLRRRPGTADRARCAIAGAYGNA